MVKPPERLQWLHAVSLHPAPMAVDGFPEDGVA